MAMLNKAGRAYARALIESGALDRSEEWSFTAEDSAALANAAGEGGIAKYHLGEEEDRHLYPFTKRDQDGELRLHTAALVSISKRAGEREEDDIRDAAESLLREIEALDQEGGGGDSADGGDGDGGDTGSGNTGSGNPVPSDGSGSSSLEIRKARERALLETLRGKTFETPAFRPRVSSEPAARAIDPSKIDVEARTVEFPCSSEAEIERWFGIEILDHSSGAVRLDRMRANGPLLSEHWGPQIGASKSVSIDQAKRQLITRCKFGKSSRAEEEWQDVQDDIRTGVSIRYLIHGLRLIEEREGVDVYLITDWEPTHVALVAEPADISVGIGRALNDPRQHKSKEGRAMTKKFEDPEGAPDAAAIRAQVQKEEQERSTEIRGVAKRFRGRLDGIDSLEEKALNEGWGIERFNATVVEMLGERTAAQSQPVQPPQSAGIGLSDREADRWSWMRAIRALVAKESGGGQNHADIKAAGFEIEVSRAIADKIGDEPKGIFVPYERQILHRTRRRIVPGERTVNKTTAAQGGNLVATELMSGNMIDALEARSQVLGMATIWDGLVGDINFPKSTTLPTAYHVATEGNDITAESSPGVGLVQGTPRELGVYSDITRKMLKQSSVGVDNWVEDRQDTALALMIEQMALNGSGLSGQPTGVLQTANVGAVTKPAGATAAERRANLWKMVVALKTAIRTANAEMGRLAFVTNPDVQGLLESAEKAAGNGQYIWIDGEGGGRVAGRQAISTTLCPNNLGGSTDESAIIYGNWAELFVLLWGVRDLTLDRASLSKSGGLRVVSFQDYDIQLAHPESFAAVNDLDVDNDF